MNKQNSMPSLRVDHLNMTVNSLEETERWYARVFGFAAVERGVRNGHRWAILRQSDTMLCVYEYPELKRGQGDGPRHRIFHFGLRVDDRSAWEATIEREKLEIDYGGAIRYPHSLSWYLSDPTGHELEVSYWDNDEVSFT